MDRAIRVTVIITTMGNRADMLAESIDSIKSQTVPAFELIVENDLLSIADKLNAAISRSKGEAYLVVSDDDMLMPNAIEKLTEAMMSRNYDIVSPFWQNFGSNNEINGPEPFPGPGSLITKEMWERVGGYDNKMDMGIDADFGYNCKEHGAKWKIIPDILAKFRVHSGNGAGKNDWEKTNKLIKEKYNGKY